MLILAGALTAMSLGSVQSGDEWITRDIEPAVSDTLIDPESARFEWPFKFTRRENGWVTCGTVNSRNRMGGYAGKAAVIVVYNEGREPYFNILEEDYGRDGFYGMCGDWVRKGILQPR